MARETTPQDRAAAIVDKVKSELTPIWLGGRQRMLLKREIAEALTATRRAALLEAAQVAITYGERARDEDLSGGYTSELIAQALDRLAQEGS